MRAPLTGSATALTEQASEYLLGLGADLVGIADASIFTETPMHKRPTSILRDAHSVIVFIRRIPFGSATPHPTPSYLQAGYYGIEEFINKLSSKLTRWLEDRGYQAAGCPAGRDIVGLDIKRRGTDPQVELLSTFDLRYAAVKAGLGQIGANNNLITGQYGSRFRIGAVITDAALVADEPQEYGVVPDYCRTCGFRCVKACPAKALPGDGAVDHYKCMVIHPDRVDPQKAIETLERRYAGAPNELASKMMGFTQNAPHTCATCITLCPMDQSREHRRRLLDETAQAAAAIESRDGGDAG